MTENIDLVTALWQQQMQMRATDGSSPMKLCVDCKHFAPGAGYGQRQCIHPSNLKQSPVTGDRVPQLNPVSMRQLKYCCGPDAKFFEQKRTTAWWRFW